MPISPGLEGHSKDGIRIAVIRNHNVLVASTGAYWESPRIIGIQFTYVFHANMKLVTGLLCLGRNERRARWCGRLGRLGLG